MGTAIDCGCGPIGGLAVMARSVVSALGLENVELIAGDIHGQETAMLGGPPAGLPAH